MWGERPGDLVLRGRVLTGLFELSARNGRTDRIRIDVGLAIRVVEIVGDRGPPAGPLQRFVVVAPDESHQFTDALCVRTEGGIVASGSDSDRLGPVLRRPVVVGEATGNHRLR